MNIFKLYKTLDPVILSFFLPLILYNKKSFKELLLKKSDITEQKKKNKTKGTIFHEKTIHYQP